MTEKQLATNLVQLGNRTDLQNGSISAPIFYQQLMHIRV